MAREPSELGDDNDVDTGPDGGEDGGNRPLLGRRGYVKLAGAATAGSLFAGTVSGNDEYDEITARGQTIQIGQGETFENTLIDLSTGDSVLLHVTGGNSTIRNVGFEGLHRGGGFMISISAPSGDVLIENVYLGDGSTKEGGSHVHGPGAVFMHQQANCDVTFRHCNVQGWPNNGFYCSNTASGGSAQFENCYGKNNGVSTFRVAGGNDAIDNCVAYNDSTDYGPGWGGYVEDQGRPVWVWSGGTVSIEDSEFAAGSYPYAMVVDGAAHMSGGAISGSVQGSLERQSVSSSADLSMPEGVPTSATEAASGATGSDPGSGDEDEDKETDEDADALEHVLVFDGDSSAVTRYEFAVSGEVEPSTDEGATIDPGVGTDVGVAHGVVADWKDAFRFSGDLEQLTVDGPATVSLDGEAIDPADYGEDLPHVLEVEGRGVPTNFEITVDGTIELEGDEDPEDEATTISGSTVQGSVTDATQTFRFSGAVTDVTFIEGEAALFVDGEGIDPADYGEHELLPHALVIDGSEDDGSSSYRFQVDGTVVKSTFRDATIDEDDVIDDGVVSGEVDEWLDAYWFDGNVESLLVSGDATVDVQYNVRDQ